MHLLSCLSPKRVFNKHINQYVWVPCRECEYCRNSHAARWTQAIERERQQHRFSMFVTLTYDNIHLPRLTTGTFNHVDINDATYLVPSKKDDFVFPVGLLNDLDADKADRDYFNKMLEYGSIPYASSYDIQSFHKRLNKYIHDNITFKYQNFRYFVCSEYGVTCLRPHFHGIYFIDDSEVANRFAECISNTWQQGIVDCQFVEKSAGSYVAQYVNKSLGLPCFYKKGPLRQKFYFSRCPVIGDYEQLKKSDQEIFDNTIVEEVQLSKDGTKFTSVPLRSSVQNRLFPKCFAYGTVSHFTRVALYGINKRFEARSPYDLALKILRYVEIAPLITEFDLLLEKVVKEYEGIHSSFFNWVRRVYYVSNRVLSNIASFRYHPYRGDFKISLIKYVYKIEDYWSKFELRCLRMFYTFQQDYAKQYGSDSLVMMYPEFALVNCGSIKEQIDMFEPIDYRVQEKDAKYLNEFNRLTHFKNGYIEAQILKSDNPIIYLILKMYHYAKKCNETCQAFPT